MKLSQIHRVFSLFSALEKTHLYTHHAQLFLYVAIHQPCTVESISDAMGISVSSVTRTLQALGDVDRKGNPGFGLVETHRDPSEGRRFLARLTPWGERFSKALERA